MALQFPQINWNMLSQMGDSVAELGPIWRERQLRNEMTDAINKGDYGAAYDAVLKNNPVAGLELLNRRVATEYKAANDAAKANKPPKLAASQYKALYDAEGKLPGLENTISTLERVLRLNPKTFDGWFAGERANVGARGPEWLSSAAGIDKEGALATEEWSRLMTPEAIQQMSASFKGSTTEKELLTMLNQLADPATPKPIRDRVTRRMLELTKKEASVYRSRVNSLKPLEGAGEVPESGGEMPSLTEGAEVDGYRYLGGDPNDQDSWEAIE